MARARFTAKLCRSRSRLAGAMETFCGHAAAPATAENAKAPATNRCIFPGIRFLQFIRLLSLSKFGLPKAVHALTCQLPTLLEYDFPSTRPRLPFPRGPYDGHDAHHRNSQSCGPESLRHPGHRTRTVLR